MSEQLFDTILVLPELGIKERYDSLVGLDSVKERLEKEAEALLRPDLLDKWSKEHHGARLAALDLFSRRPPLFIFEGDVGTGKTELAITFGDRVARQANMGVEVFCLSLKARGSGAVGEMTRLVTEAISQFRAKCPKRAPAGKRPTGASILLIDEADALAQSRELSQMHHEDRAGVNALIRGIDELAAARLPALVVMCTNRLSALDPAVRRRAAAVFSFSRPSLDLRVKMLSSALAGTSLSEADITTVAEGIGQSAEREHGFTCSDITQRFVPALVLAAYPSAKITKDLAVRVAREIVATPPFGAHSSQSNI